LNPWELIILQPVVNILIVLTDYLFDNFGLAIIALTIIVRVITLPLTTKQLRATKGMQELQPKIAELQQKYGKDKQKLAQEQMRLYKESGMSPAGCMLPMLVQMPVWIALFQAILLSLAVAPEGLLNLSRYLYSWPQVYPMLPLGKEFLGLNLAEGNFILAILVGGTMWVQQKMVTPVTTDPRQQAQSRMMLWMMPLMFGFFCLTFPSGLALYWLVSNVITIVIQYYMTGWGALVPSAAGKPAGRDKKYIRRITQIEETRSETPVEADIVVPSSEGDYGQTGDKSQERGGGYPPSLRTIRRQSGRGGGHRPKRR
jgi:YidC/Oxa1 family membrane protein insertase